MPRARRRPGWTGATTPTAAIEFRTRAYEATFSYAEVGEDFNPEVGFLERPDGYRQVSTAFRRHLRTPGLAKLGLRELEPHAQLRELLGIRRPAGNGDAAHRHPLGLRERLPASTSTALNVQYEGLREPFEVYPGVVVPAGSYRSPYFCRQRKHRSAQVDLADMAWNIGGFLSGNQVSLVADAQHPPRRPVDSSLRWTRNDIDLPQGAFVTNLGAARLTYNFSTLVNASTLIQYNDRTRRWSTNLRFNWLRTAATGLYVVYNDTEAFNGLGPVNRAFVVKYAHQVDVLR